MVLGAAAEAGHVPRRVVGRDDLVDAGLPALGERDHARERLLGQDLAERRPDGRQGERIARQRATDAADVGVLDGHGRSDAVRHACGHAVGADRHAAADGLADDEHVGLQPVRGRHAAGTGAQGVRLVDEQERARLAGQPAHGVVVAGLGQDDADVGQGRLDQHDGHVAGGERAFQGLDVVEGHDLGRLRRVDLRAEVAAPRLDPAVRRQPGEGLVDRAVVAVVVDDDLGPAR